MRRKYPMTEWGLKASEFRLKYGLSVLDLCLQAGVSVASFQAVAIGKTPGEETVKKIDAYIAEIERTKKPPAVQQFAAPRF